ncbi:MAG TPA: hypothetical protein V6C88_01175 [Chroococcidiopsis sp.]
MTSDLSHRYIIAQTPTPPVQPVEGPRQRSAQLDLIIVTVYLICVVYVFYQARQSLDHQTAYEFQSKALDEVLTKETIERHSKGEDGEEKLEVVPLKDLIGISLKPEYKDRFKLEEQPKKLSLTVENKSTDYIVYIHWNLASLIDYENQTHQLVRLTGGKRGEQSTSTVPSKTKFSTDITADHLLKPDEKGTGLEPGIPITDIVKLGKDAENKKTPQKKKDLYANFMSHKEKLSFWVKLPLQLTEIKSGVKSDRWYIFDCEFKVELRPWTEHLPLKPKK